MGGTAYVFCLLGWFWSTILYLPYLQSILDKFESYYPDAVKETGVPIQSSETNVTLAIVGMVITITMICLTIFILARIPITLAKAGRKITHEPAEIIAPLVTRYQHKKNSSKRQRIIAYRLTMAFKILLITLPVILTISSQLVDQPLDITISIIISSSLGTVAGIFFVIQMLLANLWKLDRKELW